MSLFSRIIIGVLLSVPIVTLAENKLDRTKILEIISSSAKVKSSGVQKIDTRVRHSMTPQQQSIKNNDKPISFKPEEIIPISLPARDETLKKRFEKAESHNQNYAQKTIVYKRGNSANPAENTIRPEHDLRFNGTFLHPANSRAIEKKLAFSNLENPSNNEEKMAQKKNLYYQKFY